MTTPEQRARRRWGRLVLAASVLATAVVASAQQMVTETRDPKQTQDEDFARSVKEWTTQPYFVSPLVDHLPRVPGIPMPKDVLGYHVGAPAKLTYYADILRYYKALAAATPRVRVETIGKSDEDRELVVVWVSSDENIRNLQTNRDNLARIADPRGLSEDQVRQLVATTRPHYHLMGGLHSGETGPSEMLMELAYRLATETSPLITGIRENVIVSITPVADPDGRDRNVDWFYKTREESEGAGTDAESAGPSAGGAGTDAESARGRRESAGAAEGAKPVAGTGNQTAGGRGQAAAGRGGGGAGGRGGAGLPYWGKYVFHDNNRDINLSQMSMRAIADWYFSAHPPIMHDLHESLPLLYTYSGAAPQNPNLDPILFTELPFFSNFELSQMTKWGMPGVYTHAFMDGWSPGYLGSVAYNHNGMMRMYETQSGSEPRPGAAQGRGGRGRGGEGGGDDEDDATGEERGGRGEQAAGRAGRGSTSSPQAGSTGSPQAAGRGGRGAAGPPTGRGGSQQREWYRGLPVPPGAAQNFSRRNNTNYMQTAVLSGLQLTSMFPNLVVDNFYRKTKNSIESGKNDPPYGYVIPVQRDMTRTAQLVNLLRVQRIEVGVAKAGFKTSEGTFPAGSYVIKRDQPYGRLAKNLLERQQYPDPNLRTYDDSGWTMGLALLADVKEIKDKAILSVPTTPVETAVAKGKVTGRGSAGMAIAHFGSNNMIALRYRLRTVPMKIADKSFKAEGIEFPAGSFVITAPADLAPVRAAVEELGLTAATLSSTPSVAMHDADVPRVAIYSSWDRSTQEIGWVRFTFDKFGIPFDLIYKERVKKGNLRDDYDVIVMPTQNAGRAAVFAPPGARPVSYKKSEKYKFLGMYGETDDMTGGMGAEGVEAFQRFLDAGGTLVTMGNAVRFPTELGMGRTVDAGNPSSNFYAPRPIVDAEVLRLDHPVFYGYTEKIMPIKYLGGPLLTVGEPDRSNVLARYVGGEDAVLSGLMRGADEIRERPFAVDIPGGFSGKGRVVMFANNPIYRWQNHGEFNMVFNTLLNWNDLDGIRPRASTTTSSER